ncbi:MAG TPA: hypothetical protein VK003_09215 [Oceanobacillus sp.]|nr:hypothetical protein [Oceanobacillus sp.]
MKHLKALPLRIVTLALILALCVTAFTPVLASSGCTAIVSPRDAASGLPTGICSVPAHTIKSPRDSASGQATG